MLKAFFVAAGFLAAATVGHAAPPVAKNWSAPAAPIYAQALSNDLMKAHPDLLSVTFHGVPPGMHDVYTMFAGSYPDRIGNPDDLDDIDVSVKGITILDPRWHRTKDPVAKFVVLMPLRDAAAQNIGLLVLAYRTPNAAAGEREYFRRAMDTRDALQAKIPSYEALFAPAAGR